MFCLLQQNLRNLQSNLAFTRKTVSASVQGLSAVRPLCRIIVKNLLQYEQAARADLYLKVLNVLCSVELLQVPI